MCCLDLWTRLKSALLLPAIIFSGGCSGDSARPAVKVIVPFAPGGGSDTLARVLIREIESQHPSASWAIINVPGAGGTIGSRRVKSARPDGKTLLFLHDGILTARYAGQALYGPEAFQPVAVTGRLGMVLCVAETGTHRTLPELLAAASKQPETVTFAANIGAPSYFMARQLEHAHGKARFRYVQSGGGARRFADLSGGHVAATAFSVSEYLNFRGGGVKALAILDASRHPSLPAVPTAAELGLEIEYSNLQAWWAPIGTPDDEIMALQDILKNAMDSPSIQEFFSEQCIDPLFLDGKALTTAMASKAAMLESLDLEFTRKHLPPVEAALAFFSVLGLLLAFGGTQRGRDRIKVMDEPRSGTRPGWLVMVIVAFVGLLGLPGELFLIAGIGFVFALHLMTVGTSGLYRSMISAVAAPLVLYLFLSVLLKIDLP